MKRFPRLSKYAKATLRFLFTIAAVVDFALAGTRWAQNEDMAVRLIAWGLFNLAIVLLFIDRDNPPEQVTPMYQETDE